ncbi:MAG: hypothetical protein ACRDQA_28540 [Nocardioidaceae bacterium]
MHPRLLLVPLALASAGLMLAACGGPAAPVAQRAPAKAPSAASQTRHAESTSSGATPDVTKIGAHHGWEYRHGLRVRVASVEPFTVSRLAAGGHPGDRGALATVKITNGSDHTVDTTGTTVYLRAGDGIACET